MNAEEETATLENLSINTMYLNDAVLLIIECQSYTILYKIYFSMCAALTKIETCHIQAHEVCRIHACTIQHIYCIIVTNLFSRNLVFSATLPPGVVGGGYPWTCPISQC